MESINNNKKHKLFLIRSRWLFATCFCLFVFSVSGQNTGSSFRCEDGDEILEKADLNNFEKFEENLALFSETLKLLEEHECWDSYIACLNAIASVYYYQRDYIEASEVAQKALSIGKKYGLEQSHNYSVAIVIKSYSVESMGDYEESIQLQKEALKLMEEKGDNREAIALTQEGIGVSYFSKGDYQMAVSYFEQALQIHSLIDAGETLHFNARNLMFIGDCYKDQGQVQQALNYYLQSLEIHQKLPRDQFYEQTERLVYKGLVEVYTQLEDRAKATHYIDKAVAIHEKYPGLLMAYQSYLSFGKFYLEEEAFDKAQVYFKTAQAEAHEEYKLYERHPSMALTEAAMGDLYVEKKQWTTAFQHYQKALDLISLDFESTDEWLNPKVGQLADKLAGFEILQAKANALYGYSASKKGDLAALKKALETFQLIGQLIRNVRQGYLIDDTKFAFAEKVLPVYEQAIEVSLELHSLTRDVSYLEQAFLFAEANKAETLYESITNERAKSLSDIPDTLLAKERSIRTALAYNEKTLLEEQQKKEADQQYIETLRSRIFKLKEQYLAISQQLETDYPSYFKMKAEVEALTLTSVRALLDEGMALIEYMIGEKSSYAFFITEEDIKVYSIGAAAAQLSDQVLLLREHVSYPPAYEESLEDYQVFVQTANDLYTALLEEGLNQLKGSINRLVIIPDASLSNLPFELLLTQSVGGSRINYTPGHLSYLLKEYAICYQYSARLMSLHGRPTNKELAKHNFIGFAPDFGDAQAQASRSCNENGLSSLRFNQEEVSKITQLLGGKACLGSDAHLEQFLKEAPDYKIVHLATHACVNEQEAALNRIFFTDSNFSQHELNTLQLNAELVVLSACNTGVGKLLKGEGVMSLARGFMQAGGNSLLTSLWAVDDYATAVQMVAYYENLMAGLPKDIALREAKLAYLNQVDPEFAHPFYWSAFVQFGNADGIVEAKSRISRGLVLLVFGLALVFGAGVWAWRRKRNSFIE